MTNSGIDNRQQGTKNYSMTAWLGTRVCFIDLTWSKRPGRRRLRFSKPGTIIRHLIFQIMLWAPGGRKQPCALSNAISIIGFPRTGRRGILRRTRPGEEINGNLGTNYEQQFESRNHWRWLRRIVRRQNTGQPAS